MTKTKTPRISAPINEDTAERLRAIADHMGQGFSPANVAALAIADGLPLLENRLTGKPLPDCFRLAVRTVPIDSSSPSEVAAEFERSEDEYERRKAAGLIREVVPKNPEPVEDDSDDDDEEEAAQALAAGLPEVKPPPKAKAPKKKKAAKKAPKPEPKPEPQPEPIKTMVGGIELTWEPGGDESLPEYFARVQSAQIRNASGNGRADQSGALDRANGYDDDDDDTPGAVDPTRCPHGVRWDAPEPCDACDSSGF